MVVGTCWNGVDFCLEWSLARALCIVSAEDPHFIKVYSWGYKNTSPNNIAWIPVVSSIYCAFNWPPCTFCISNWKMSWKTWVQVISIKRWSINGKWLWLMDLNKSTINAWDPCSLVARHLVEIQWQQTHDLRSFFLLARTWLHLCWWALPCLCPGNLKQNYVRYSGVTDIIAVHPLNVRHPNSWKPPTWHKAGAKEGIGSNPGIHLVVLLNSWRENGGVKVTRWWPFWGNPLLRYIDHPTEKFVSLSCVVCFDSSWASYK